MRLFAILAVLTAMLSQVMALEVGQKAPSLAKITWMKGAAVETGTAVTVVEFWATWCGPCKTSIPHLTELQKKYADKVHIVGISNEDAATVRAKLKTAIKKAFPVLRCIGFSLTLQWRF